MTNISTFKGTNAFETLGVTGGAGTAISTGASSGIKGTWVTLGTTGFNYDGLVLFLKGFGSSRGCQIDIGYGATPDIAVADSFWVATTNCNGLAYNFPVRVPAGVALRVRIATNGGSGDSAAVSACGYQYNGWNRGFTYAEALNTFSSGFPVTGLALPGNTTQTAWTQLIAATANDYDAIVVEQPYVVAGTTTAAEVQLQFGIGAAAAESPLFSLNRINVISISTLERLDRFIMPCAIPKGSRISFRLQASSGTSANVYRPNLLGFVP